MSRSAVVFLAFAIAYSSATATAQRPEARKIETGVGSDFRVVFKVFQDCTKSQVSRTLFGLL